ncbi:YolD-like family protein [Paenibacillus sp. GCM10027627]|uniref:YolD-like family protein n=1 Tax=unclassified Paenibacillus TaxID=185978 RepID=UPI003645A11C
MAKGTAKPKRPTRDEYVLEELGERLVEAHQEEATVRMDVWNWEEPVQGRIVHMDSRTKLVHVEQHGEITKVPFMDIMSLQNAGADY